MIQLEKQVDESSLPVKVADVPSIPVVAESTTPEKSDELPVVIPPAICQKIVAAEIPPTSWMRE